MSETVMAEAKEPKHKSGQAPVAQSSSRIKRLPEHFTNYEVQGKLSATPSQKALVGDLKDSSSSFTDGSVGASVLGNHKHALVHMARFSGKNPERWVSQADRYFDFYNIREDDWMTIASFYFDEEAADWYTWMHRNRQLVSWELFTEAVIHRFRSRDLEEPEGLLAKLYETTLVATYRAQFETITNRTMYLPPPFLVRCFVFGLRGDIKQLVLIHKPATLDDAMDLAQLHEQRIMLEKGVGHVSLGGGKPLLPTTKAIGSNVVSNSAPLRSVLPLATRTKVGFRRLSPTEAAHLRAQGLCYHFDEKYSWDHKCKSTPQLLLFDDDPDPLLQTLSPEPSYSSPLSDAILADKLPPQEVQAHSSISYNALAGGYSVSTLRFTGTINGKSVQVLLDGSSKHYFVQTRVAQFLHLPIEDTSPFSVVVGSGDRLLCTEVVRQLPLVIQEHTLYTDFYVLPLQGWDLVLGVSWLATLGPVVTNYATSRFKFQSKGTNIVWQGNIVPVAHPVQFNSLRCLCHTHAIEECFHLELMSPNATPLTVVPAMQQILDEFADVFSKPHGLPPSHSIDHAVTLVPQSSPVKVRPYRYTHFQKQEIEKLVVDMLQEGIIQPSNSPYSSPVLLVRKKDGTWRFCVDYRSLNAITICDQFPIPSIDELFDELHGAVYFSKLDLLAEYHQIRIKQTDVEKMAFRTHDGHYEFLVMPFDMSNVPSTFQRLMNDIFRPYLRQFVLFFFDDILIYSSTWDAHVCHVRLVLQLLRTHHLVAKLSKCVFGQQSIGYLGHIISAQGFYVDPKKIASICQWPQPQTVKEVRNFLGLARYYGRFIRNYAMIASPLTNLLRKDAFNWTSAAAQAFSSLKKLLSSTPVLRLPDFTQPFTVETDASGTAIGAILSQQGHPLAFFTQKLNPTMQRASTYLREKYAILQAIAKWRQYLLGRKFTIYADQQALKNLQTQVIQTPEQKNGSQRRRRCLITDFILSIFAYSRQAFCFIDELRIANKQHPELLKLHQQLENDPKSLADYVVRDGLLFFRDRLVVPSDSNLRQQLLLEFHSSPIGGHSGVHRTFHRLASNFFWPYMRRDVQQFVAECHTCQQMKSSSLPPSGLLQPLPLPSLVFEGISVDFITGAIVASAFVSDIVRLHGIPAEIVSDRDSRFMTDFW
ncbi:hypothetical protein GQ457_01G021920 [Hibiscus cannabinus]